jgi:hypothetical protein
VPLAAVLVSDGSFRRRHLPGASEEYRLDLQNVSSHVLGPVGDIQVLFPGRLNGSVVATEIIPAVDADAAAGDATPAPISFIRPGQRVELLVLFSWFCPDGPVHRPRAGPTTIRAELEMAAFRVPAVYALDAGAPPDGDAFSLSGAACRPQ